MFGLSKPVMVVRPRVMFLGIHASDRCDRLSGSAQAVFRCEVMAKRLRSLASLLWDTDSDHCDMETSLSVEARDCKLRRLQEENAGLAQKNKSLEEQIDLLRMAKPRLKAPQVESRLKSELLAAWPAQSWLMHLTPDVILPRLWEELLPALHESNNAQGQISFHLSRSPKASNVLSHAERCIEVLFSKHPAVFKVGISASPLQRWSHSGYGYSLDRRERWQGMKVLAACESSFSAALVESALIKKFQGMPGCRNERPGGETPSPEPGPHFTYVVYRILVPPPRVASSAIH